MNVGKKKKNIYSIGRSTYNISLSFSCSLSPIYDYIYIIEVR